MGRTRVIVSGFEEARIIVTSFENTRVKKVDSPEVRIIVPVSEQDEQEEAFDYSLDFDL
jgi:hypothetical protein